jgi:homocitrate synthase
MALAEFAIVDTTLREGEQFANGDFTTSDKIEIARTLAAIGIEYIELTSPAVSPRALADCEAIAGLGLTSRIVAHIRCHADDARIALGSGVGAISMVMGASPILRATSHRLALDEIVRRALGVAAGIRKRAPAIELRFSTEDAFRCPARDLLAIFRPLAASGLFDRFGLADTTGSALPLQVHETVRLIAAETGRAIEFHGHNDTGCAVANALTAHAAGATHLDTTILGIGERNGIASLEGVIAGLYVQDPAAIRAKYDLPRLAGLAALVAAKIGIDVPFNHCIVGSTAFTHKAGIHTKAIINDPHSYEVLAPEDFGRERAVLVAHRLAGHNAIGARAESLGLALSAGELRQATSIIKAMADQRRLTDGEVNDILLTMTERRAAG